MILKTFFLMSSINWTGIQELYSVYNNMLQSWSLKIEALSFLFCHLLMLSLFLNLFLFYKEISTTILPYEHCRNHDEPQLFEQPILSIRLTIHVIEILMINMSIFCNKMTSMDHQLKVETERIIITLSKLSCLHAIVSCLFICRLPIRAHIKCISETYVSKSG